MKGSKDTVLGRGPRDRNQGPKGLGASPSAFATCQSCSRPAGRTDRRSPCPQPPQPSICTGTAGPLKSHVGSPPLPTTEGQTGTDSRLVLVFQASVHPFPPVHVSLIIFLPIRQPPSTTTAGFSRLTLPQAKELEVVAAVAAMRSGVPSEESLPLCPCLQKRVALR